MLEQQQQQGIKKKKKQYIGIIHWFGLLLLVFVPLEHNPHAKSVASSIGGRRHLRCLLETGLVTMARILLAVTLAPR